MGKLLVRGGGTGGEPREVRVVETEAYPPGDEAGHAWRGITPRNRSLFLRRGHAYVYLAYGVCWMMNVSSEIEGVGAGVLIRAGAPEAGVPTMLARRGTVAPRDLARGPGRLARAMDIDRSLDGLDLCAPGPLFLAAGAAIDPNDIGVSARIGISRAIDRKLRFFVRGSPFVSGPGWLNAGAPRAAVSRARPRSAMLESDEGPV